MRSPVSGSRVIAGSFCLFWGNAWLWSRSTSEFDIDGARGAGAALPATGWTSARTPANGSRISAVRRNFRPGNGFLLPVNQQEIWAAQKCKGLARLRQEPGGHKDPYSSRLGGSARNAAEEGRVRRIVAWGLANLPVGILF